MNEAIERPGSRVVVLDDLDRVLLFRYEEADESFWVTPGGGLEPGETHEQAAARELHEEVGVLDVSLERLNWTRKPIVWTASWNAETYRSREEYFMARVPSGVRISPTRLDEWEIAAETRWWSVDELEQAQAAGVTIWPERLPALLRSLLEHGPPEADVP
jgi:8-oxo-dGTP pyrophosphatase MutT (NUDIX family)